MANIQAIELISSLSELLQYDVTRPGTVDPIAARITMGAADSNSGLASEARLPDGRWLRVSRSLTQERGVIVVYSDITALKQQEAELHETNLRLDAALKNMSQGLCLYDSEGRLQGVNH